MKITNCKINHMVNPLGYHMEKVTASWQAEDAVGKYQKQARIVVALDEACEEVIYDTGYSASLNPLATVLDFKPEPCTRYYWQVTVQSDAGEEAVSQMNWFETAKMDEAWKGKWISCRKKDRHPVFGKEFSVTKKIQYARIYICGLGLYEAVLNGKKVGDELLTPYCNNYHAWKQYQTYDITGFLVCGNNSLQVTVAPGWYAGRFGYFSKPGDSGHYGADDRLIAELQIVYSDGTREIFGTDESWGWYAGRFGYFSKPGDSGHYGADDRLIAELQIVYSDGTREIFGTDESWRVTRSTITASNIYDGESRDDTLPDTEPEDCFYVEEKAPLVARYSLPVKVQEVFYPTELIRTPSGELVYDLGQNISGIFSLHVRAKRGDKIHIQFGEVLQNGCFYNENLRTALAEYCYISDGIEKELVPSFTFYGYRYVKVEGIEELSVKDLKGLAIYSDLPQTGSLVTGNEKLNRLIKNVEYGQKDNFVDVPTDCPQRDERLGWTGDAQVFSATSCFLRDSFAFYRKYLHDMKTEQDENDGMVPDIIPSLADDYRATASVWGDAACIIPWNVYQFLHDMKTEQDENDGMVPDIIPSLADDYRATASVWGDAACIIPWNVYQFYGDQSILAESYEGMKDWVSYIRRIDGDCHLWKKQFHYGDWLALDHPSKKEDMCMGGTYEGYIAEVYYYNSVSIVRKTAELLGREEDAASFRRLEKWLLSEIQDEYFTKNGRCAVDTQTGLLLGLYYNLIENKKNMQNRLFEKLKQSEGNLQTGFVGTPFLLGQITEAGKPHQAYDILLNENYPGWLYEVNLGATTIWERWNSLNPDGTISSVGMNSFNHYSYGAVLEWLCRYGAGLNQIDGVPGFKETVLKPYPDIRLGKLDFTYQSAAGTYHVFWETLSNTKLHAVFRVPFDCKAVLYLPQAADGRYGEQAPMELTAGSYEYCYETAEPMCTYYQMTDKLEDVIYQPKVKALLDTYLPGMTGLPNAMRWKTLQELTADSRVKKISKEELEEFQEKLRQI